MAKNFGILIILSVVVLSFVGTVSAETRSVDGSNFTEIQEAIDTASAGDRILVYPGVYRENVIVNKPVRLKGIGNPVVDASGSGIAITLRADGITLEGLNVTNSGSSRGDAGIKVISCNNIILGNNVSNNAHGIHIYKSRNNTITGNNVSDNMHYGIALFSSSINTITDNDVSDSDYGIDLYYSCINTITDNNVSNNRYGIRLDESGNNDITGNTVSNSNVDGFHLRYSIKNSIVGNNVSNSHGDGFDLWYSSNNNTITGNTVSNNRYGIRLDESGNNIITGNTFVNGALFVSDSYKNIVEENIVNGKPLVFLEDTSDIEVTDAGQVILVNCNNITVENLDLSNTNVGIDLWNTENSRISKNKLSNNRDGIRLWYSSNNNIAGNDVNDNDKGISLDKSSNNSISGNTVSNNRYGIRICYSSNNNIGSNDVSDNDDGISLSNSCFNNNIVGNTFVNDGLSIYSSYQNTVEGNRVNGKPLVYLENISDFEVTDAGQVILVNCDNITIENLDLSTTSVGIELLETENSRISNNRVSNNERGICFYESGNNSITNNNVGNNNWYGISLYESSNNTIAGNNAGSNKRGISLVESHSNKIYLNNFINNDDTFHSFDSTNIWNSIEEITYLYNGTICESYLGNYWDDYEEKYPDAEEIDSTGIWDAPYSIDMDNDFYPLMMRFKNYVRELPEAQLITLY